MTSSSSSAASSKSSPLLPPSDLLDWPPPLQPGAAPPKPGPELIGARTDGELLQALSLTASSAREPTFVLFGSSWCQHCHEMLGHFDAVARTAYQGFKEEEEGEEKPAPLLGGPLAALRSALDRLSGKKGEGEDEDATVGGGGEEGDKSRRKNKSNGGGRGRFVAARVDFMSRAASHVRYTPTVSVYRGAGSKKRVVDGFHGGDAQRLADRAWLHLGGGRRRWGWC